MNNVPDSEKTARDENKKPLPLEWETDKAVVHIKFSEDAANPRNLKYLRDVLISNYVFTEEPTA